MSTWRRQMTTSTATTTTSPQSKCNLLLWGGGTCSQCTSPPHERVREVFGAVSVSSGPESVATVCGASFCENITVFGVLPSRPLVPPTREDPARITQFLFFGPIGTGIYPRSVLPSDVHEWLPCFTCSRTVPWRGYDSSPGLMV